MAFGGTKYLFALTACRSFHVWQNLCSPSMLRPYDCPEACTKLPKLLHRRTLGAVLSWSQKSNNWTSVRLCPVPLMQSEPQSATKIYKGEHNRTMPYIDSPRFTPSLKKYFQKSVDVSGSAAAASVLAVQHMQQWCNNDATMMQQWCNNDATMQQHVDNWAAKNHIHHQKDDLIWTTLTNDIECCVNRTNPM